MVAISSIRRSKGGMASLRWRGDRRRVFVHNRALVPVTPVFPAAPMMLLIGWPLSL